MKAKQSAIAECAETRKVKRCSSCVRYGDSSPKGCPHGVGPSVRFPDKAIAASITKSQLYNAMRRLLNSPVTKLALQPQTAKERSFLLEPSSFPFPLFLSMDGRKPPMLATALSYENGKLYFANLRNPSPKTLLLGASPYPQNGFAKLCYEAERE